MTDMSKPGPDPQVSDSQLLQAIRQDERPFSTTGAVEKRVSLSGNRVRQRLKTLSKDGPLECWEVARNIKIYWLESSDTDAK